MRLQFEKIAPDMPFHAALVTTHPRRPAGRHTHDFSEMMYVLQGTGTHWINGAAEPLEPGRLLWIRPRDCHTVCAPPGTLHFVNLAFPAPAWQAFAAASGLEEAATLWDSAPAPPSALIPAEDRAGCVRAFRQALSDFHDSPTRFALCRFWAAALPALLPREERAAAEAADLPAWLAGACAAMASPDNLRAGAGRMAQAAGVSPAHLSRTLKALRGQTPTEFVLELRLRRAAALLRTGAEEIGDIALDCGFENLSYFYRCFRQRFGQTPRAYRQDPRHRVLPLR